MSLEKTQLTTKELKQLIIKHRSVREKRYADRIKAIIMLDRGYSIQEVAEILLIDRDTVTNLVKKYIQEGVDGLIRDNFQTYTGRLTDDQENELRRYLTEHLFSTALEVLEYINKEYGIKYSHDGTVKLLHRLGFVYKKTKAVPAKADREKQETFISEYETLRNTLKKGEKIYFLDAMHPIHNNTPDYAWIEKGKEKEIKTVPGRSRLNINGVYSPCDHETILRSVPSVNAVSTLALLRAIANKHPELDRIIVFHDNARVNHSRYLKSRLPATIEMRPLPSYSPNLNLIERLWKYFRNEVTNNHYHATFEDFKTASSSFFKSLRGRKEKLASLMAENFHVMNASC
jgi:transposase